MLRLARVLLDEYAALKRQRGLVDMNDLERVAEAMELVHAYGDGVVRCGAIRVGKIAGVLDGRQVQST